MTGLAPFEIHGATTNTKTGVLFNIVDLVRTVLRIGPWKGMMSICVRGGSTWNGGRRP